jgi:hypothetical protein
MHQHEGNNETIYQTGGDPRSNNSTEAPAPTANTPNNLGRVSLDCINDPLHIHHDNIPQFLVDQPRRSMILTTEK